MIGECSSEDPDLAEWAAQHSSGSSVRSLSKSERKQVLDAVADFVQTGVAVLEDLPDLKSQLLYLQSGEIYWLRAHDIMRLK
jgi:hypothetical protein